MTAGFSIAMEPKPGEHRQECFLCRKLIDRGDLRVSFSWIDGEWRKHEYCSPGCLLGFLRKRITELYSQKAKEVKAQKCI